jgi:hypothetical protein
MGELEPDDSRNVTLSDQQAPGEPPRTGPRESETRQQQHQQGGQSQSQESDWRATEATRDRDAQDHELAGDFMRAPSLDPEADDGQWSQQPEQLGDAPAGQAEQGIPESDLQLGTELRGPRDSMRRPDDGKQREQSERGGG